jgi:hypothetical protein
MSKTFSKMLLKDQPIDEIPMYMAGHSSVTAAALASLRNSGQKSTFRAIIAYHCIVATCLASTTVS